MLQTETKENIKMPIYDVTIFSESDDREIYHEKVFAMDEDTAIDQTTEGLREKGIVYGVCMAEEL